MRTVKEIEEQIQKEREYITQLYIQISAHEQSMKSLEKEEKMAKKEEEQMSIDNWFNEHFGIPNQKEAIQKPLFIVFNEDADFIKTITIENDKHYVNLDENTVEHWLRKNKLYAHRASSFCNRDKYWYDYLSLKEQLRDLGWEFEDNGKLKKTQW